VTLLLGATIFLVAGQRLGVVSRFLAWSPIVLLGEASYSMYIFQRPLAQYLNAILVRVGLPVVESNWWSLGLYLVVLTAFSIFIYKKFEAPVRRRIRERLIPRP